MSDRPKKVLVVDDSPTVRRLVELVLSQNGYEIFSAEDGETGLKLAQQHCPDVILVDFVMPRMNGHMFCKALRQDARLSKTPVILISSKSEVVGQAFEESSGIVHYFTKPFEPEELVAKIREVCRPEEPVAAVPAAEISLVDQQRPDAPVGDVRALLDSINERFDRVVRHYFQKDFPVLMKNVLSDTLRETGLIKHQTLILSGDLCRTSLAEVLCFCMHCRHGGRLSVFSADTFAEIFLEQGRFVFATASQKGKHCFLTDLICQDDRFNCDRMQLQQVVQEAREKNLPIGRALVAHNLISEEDLMYYLRQHAQQALTTALAVREGNFFLEQDALPFNLKDIRFRLPLYEVLLPGVRQLLVPADFFIADQIVQRLPSCAEALQNELLEDAEERVALLLDGSRTLADLVVESGLNADSLQQICFVLQQSGLASLR